MPVRLEANLEFVATRVAQLKSLMSDTNVLAVRHQRLVAEIVILRLHSILEITIESCAKKLICGANYLDGHAPMLLESAQSIFGAEVLLKSYGRGKKPLAYLRWSNVRDCKRNVSKIMDSKDRFFVVLDKHNAYLEEFRFVRNHIAHNSSDTGKRYRSVLKTYYGASIRGMAVGTFLISDKRIRSRPIDKYLIQTQVVLRDLLGA